jgi:NADH:ubiquinone oxidoreductase subunit F (NADH-binding)/NADH:ubiquinone oxidoreductase subunit E
MQHEEIAQMKRAHSILKKVDYEPAKLEKGYANRFLRINLSNLDISIHPITQQMKDLWVGGKGFDLWLTFQEINKDTKWDSPENPICFSSGPLGGTTSFPGSGKTIVTAVSPLTDNMMDCNVGGYFGPYLKFAGFDALMLTGKTNEDVIVLLDAVNYTISIEKAPLESVNSHIVAEELTEMYADNEIDMRNIAVVSSGKAAEHSRMGLLNFSFWDWRRNVARLKQAGRGGIGTVFRDKKVKALVLKSQGINPAWRVEENKVAKFVTPSKIIKQNDKKDIEAIFTIIEKWERKPEHIYEMLLEIQDTFHFISYTAIEMLNKHTGLTKAGIYHLVTFYKVFCLEPKGEKVIQVCTGAACQAKGANILLETLEKKLGIKAGETTADKKYTLEAASCLGICEVAPAIKINDAVFGNVEPNKIMELLTNENPSELPKKNDTVKTVGIEKPYILNKDKRNYESFKNLITSKKNPQEIIQTIKESNLLGRGGGGFSAGMKWELCYENSQAKNLSPILVCNSSIVEPIPSLVIEGLLIAGYTLGAKEARVFFRLEHKAELERFAKEVKKVKSEGLLGKNILTSGFDFEIHVHLGAGGYVIGESSALLQTLLGKVSEPQPKYIHASENGARNVPTLVQNIETWANIPLLFETEKCCSCSSCNCKPDTKAVLISGDIKNQGMLEVKLGTSFADIIAATGGIAKRKRTIKALQIGGTGGGFLPESKLSLPYDYQPLANEGVFIGSSSIVVKDNRKCIVDSVLNSVLFLLDESCGKCTPCREGLFALKTILQKITEGKGKVEDLDLMSEIGETMLEASLCKFGKTASAPILTALKHFRTEFEEHILHKKCSCGVCKNLIHFEISKEKCVGCTICAQKCPVQAISGKTKEIHSISQEICIKCGVCYDVCNFDAVEVK